MPTRSDSHAPAGGTAQKTLQLLRKRLRQLLRVMLIMTICLAVASVALATWWLNSLNGLPDIGDPFDVETFRSFSLPDEQNAFTYLRRADQKLAPFPELPRWWAQPFGTSPGQTRIRKSGHGSRRIARRSSCSGRGPNNPMRSWTWPQIPSTSGIIA